MVMELAVWDKETPEKFYSTVTYLWLLNPKTNKVEKVPKRHSRDSPEDSVYIHADYWGDDAWDNQERGYYSDEHGLVTCHGPIKQTTIKQLARIFRDACYIRACNLD